MTRLRPFPIVLAGLMSLCSISHAQWTNSYGNTFNNPISSSLNQSSMDGINRRILLRSMLRKRGLYTEDQLQHMTEQQLLAALGGSKEVAAQAKALPPVAGAKFKPAQGRLMVDQLAAALSKDPQGQRALRMVFEQGLQAYEQQAVKEGLGNDLGGASAFFLACVYSVWHDGREPHEDGVVMASRQMQQAFDTQKMRETADADKQRLYEALVGLGTWLLFANQQAVKGRDANQRAQLRDGSGQMLQALFKLDAAKIDFTSAGLSVSR